MKFTVQPSDLKAAWSAVKSVVPSKPAIPVLENVLLRPCGDNAVTLTASDTDNVITSRMAVEDAEGLVPCLIPANRLSDYIGSAMSSDWPVMVEMDGDEMILGDGFGDFRFFCDSKVNEYPLTQQLKMEEGLRVDADAARLVDAVSAAVRFVGKDVLRPVMSGVCLDFRADGLRVAASDSKVLFCDVLRDVVAEREAVIIVNASIINAVVAHFSLSVPVSISFDSRQVCFRQDGIEIQGRLIDGKFPRYESVIPKNNNRIAVVNRSMLTAAVKRVRISANQTTEQIRLRFNGSTSLALEASDIEYSLQSKMTINTEKQENFPGEHLFALRASFFLSLLGTFGKDVTEVTLLLGDPARAVLVKSAVDSERVCLIMPMQIV